MGCLGPAVIGSAVNATAQSADWTVGIWNGRAQFARCGRFGLPTRQGRTRLRRRLTMGAMSQHVTVHNRRSITAPHCLVR